MTRSERGTVLLTGAAGRVATVLRPMLRLHYNVRLTDVRQPDQPLEPGETFVQGDLRDPGLANEATGDVAAVIHLAGEPDAAADWSRQVEFNIMIASTLFDAALAHGVPRLVTASSVHAIGGHNDPQRWPVSATAPARPCCPYGVSKGAVELLARLYSDRMDGSHVVCLRLALVTYPIRWRHEARAWLADGDLQTLVQASLQTNIRFGTYVGASDCPRPRYDLSAAADDLGWRPAVRVSDHGLPDRRPDYNERCRLWPETIDG